MSQQLVGCPLCCQATFSSTNTLCVALIAVASKSLKCPLCEEVLCGLDKLTIHLLSHLLITHNEQYSTSIYNISEQNSLNDKQNKLSTPGVKFIEEHHKCLKTIKNEFGIIKKTDEGSSSEMLQTQKIMVDDEVMLVFDKHKKQKEQSEENLMFNFVTTKNDLENKTDNLYQNTSSALLLNSIQSKDNFDTEICLKNQISDNNVDVISELNSPKPSEYCIENRKLLGVSEHSIAKDEIMFREIDKPVDINFGYQADYPVQFDNLSNSQSDQKSNSCYGLCSVSTNNSFTSVGLQCAKCMTSFVDQKMLSMHQELAHSSENSDEKKKVYSCKLCTKSFKMKGSLVVHTKVAHSAGPTALSKLLEASRRNETASVGCDITPYTCSLCGKGFKKEQYLVQHEKTHEGKLWECDVCTKTFTTKYFLKKHHLLHTGEMPYTCATCNKSFTFQQSYHKHLLYHSDDKPYQCSECGRCFKELSTLHNHQRIHTGEKPYSCETCGKCFRQRVSYLVHRRIHTGDMPYKCSECNKSFRYKVSERTHRCNRNITVSYSHNKEPLQAISQNNETNCQTETEECLPTSLSSRDHPSSAQDWLKPSCSSANDTTLVNNNSIESSDLFSLIMSPTCQYTSDKLENLRLSPDNSAMIKNSANNEISLSSCLTEDVCHDSLKDLFHSDSDYN